MFKRLNRKDKKKKSTIQLTLSLTHNPKRPEP